MTEVEKQTPLVKQYNNIKSQYPDALLFFRLGDFYELFDDDALKASKMMDVVLTRRQGRPMCGIPCHAATGYIRKLVNKSQNVAICEQVEDASKSKGIVKREVVRVITPGTVIEDDLLMDDSNNFLASLYAGESKSGCVFIDISTGDFSGCRVNTKQELESEIARLPVREIILSSQDDNLKKYIKIKFPEITVKEIDPWYFTNRKAVDLVKEYFNLSTLKGWEIEDKPALVSACGGLVRYLRQTQKEQKVQLKKFHLYRFGENMILDRDAQENLELVKNQQDGSKKNTLFSVLDFTKTSMGRRKLLQYIIRPLRDIDKIHKRLNATEEFIENKGLSVSVSEILSDISDMERIITKTSFGSCNARDLVSLKNSLRKIPDIKEKLKSADSQKLLSIKNGLRDMPELTSSLHRALKENPPLTVKEGGIIKKGYSRELDELLEISSGDRKWISNLEKKERKRLDIPSLKVGYNKVYGYYMEVTKTHSEKVPGEYERKQTLVNSERYITRELKEREDSILGAEERKCALEYKIFTDLRKKVAEASGDIQKNAGLLSELDVLNSFAFAAIKFSYTKPNVSDDVKIEIKDGRHPVVEKSMGLNSFIPNSTKVHKDAEQIILITGPNMSGKSTYLKQVALITIMAQMGSYVPSSSAKIGTADRVFTRIGAGENLAGGESTFMVEMTEVAAILNNATERSLLIMDEVGRGTSTYDGISIARAVIEEISKIGARTLFATHYFELTDISAHVKGVVNYNFAVREWKDKNKIVFLRKLQRGSADRSYGIHCAELAGVPQTVINRAWSIFSELEKNEYKYEAKSREYSNKDETPQLPLFGAVEGEYKNKIRQLDLNTLAPVELVSIINEWKKEMEND